MKLDLTPESTYGQGEPWLADHSCYVALGLHVAARQAAYRALFRDAIEAETLAAIRMSINRSRILGSTRFQEAIEAQLARRVRPGQPGRPRQSAKRRDRRQQTLL